MWINNWVFFVFFLSVRYNNNYYYYHYIIQLRQFWICFIKYYYIEGRKDASIGTWNERLTQNLSLFSVPATFQPSVQVLKCFSTSLPSESYWSKTKEFWAYCHSWISFYFACLYLWVDFYLYFWNTLYILTCIYATYMYLAVAALSSSHACACCCPTVVWCCVNCVV